jgi:hypothetical protein
MWRSRRLRPALFVLVAVCAVGGLAYAVEGGGGERVAAGAASEGTPELPVTTAPNPLQTLPAVEPAPTPEERAAHEAREQACQNSTDPKCGEFRWRDGRPGPNLPLTVKVSVAPPGVVKVGQQVVFVVDVEDPDAKIENCNFFVSYGDGNPDGGGGCERHMTCWAHGPWDVPPQTRGVERKEYSYAYTKPGVYTARFAFSSHTEGMCVDFDPYASKGKASVVVTVVE